MVQRPQQAPGLAAVFVVPGPLHWGWQMYHSRMEQQKPFFLVLHPDDGQAMFEALRAPAPPDEMGPHQSLLRGELGTIDCGFRFVKEPPRLLYGPLRLKK